MKTARNAKGDEVDAGEHCREGLQALLKFLLNVIQGTLVSARSMVVSVERFCPPWKERIQNVETCSSCPTASWTPPHETWRLCRWRHFLITLLRYCQLHRCGSLEFLVLHINQNACNHKFTPRHLKRRWWRRAGCVDTFVSAPQTLSGRRGETVKPSLLASLRAQTKQ